MGQAWRRQAACLGRDPQPFFTRGPIAEPVGRLCGWCPVRRDCLEFAMEVEGLAGLRERYGVYGGLLPGERLALAKTRYEGVRNH